MLKISLENVCSTLFALENDAIFRDIQFFASHCVYAHKRFRLGSKINMTLSYPNDAYNFKMDLL